MNFYRCSVCVVITNSEFTKPAKVLAATVGCCLICYHDIPKLDYAGDMEL